MFTILVTILVTWQCLRIWWRYLSRDSFYVSGDDTCIVTVFTYLVTVLARYRMICLVLLTNLVKIFFIGKFETPPMYAVYYLGLVSVSRVYDQLLHPCTLTTIGDSCRYHAYRTSSHVRWQLLGTRVGITRIGPVPMYTDDYWGLVPISRVYDQLLHPCTLTTFGDSCRYHAYRTSYSTHVRWRLLGTRAGITRIGPVTPPMYADNYWGLVSVSHV